MCTKRLITGRLGNILISILAIVIFFTVTEGILWLSGQVYRLWWEGRGGEASGRGPGEKGVTERASTCL